MTKRELARVFAHALSDLDPRACVERALPARPPRGLAVRVVAIGKAAPQMAAGAIARWGSAIERCVVVAPDGTSAAGLEAGTFLRLLRASHPLPDARSVRAAEACFDVVTTRDHERRAILVLVSGGASSLVCAPPRGVTLRDKQAVARAMLASGASVREINVVRKHLSRIKGGGLARAAFPNDVITLVVSDVIGGVASDVGSGPSSSDRSTVRDARRLLRLFAPAHAHLPLARTLSPRDREAAWLRARVIASPSDLSRAVARRLREQGLDVRVLAATLAPAEALARGYARWAARLTRGQALVRAAEPSVVVPPRGSHESRGSRGRHGSHDNGAGGRCTHVAALVARELARLGSRAVFAAYASDGVDGASGTAGGVVDGRFPRAILDDAIAHFATGPLLVARRAAFAEHPSGHNLADVHVLIAR